MTNNFEEDNDSQREIIINDQDVDNQIVGPPNDDE